MIKGILITAVSTAALLGCSNASKKAAKEATVQEVQQPVQLAEQTPANQSQTIQVQQIQVQQVQQFAQNNNQILSANPRRNQVIFQQQSRVRNTGSSTQSDNGIDFKNTKPLVFDPPAVDENLIQLALLLDTSNSMDGLIDQAKSQLWKIVNELAKANKNGKDIRFEVALFEYGNDGLKLCDGYIRKVQGLTSDLDQISEDLFALRTNGGSEFCGHVISSAVNRLKWNPSPKALKMIYIAGNEPFTQGVVDYKDSCLSAVSKGLITNTIFCGAYDEGQSTNWQHGAILGKGDYFSINSDKKLEGIKTPYDEELVKLSSKINTTYVAYGSRRNYYANRQVEQDKNASSISQSISAGRAASKGSKLYVNSNWDLVDAMDKMTIKLNEIKQDELPENLRGKSEKEIQTYLQEKLAERKEIQKRIADLSKKRALFIAEKLKEMRGKDENTLDLVMIKSLRSQAEAKDFSFKK